VAYTKFYEKTEAALRDYTLTSVGFRKIFRMEFVNAVLRDHTAAESNLKLAGEWLHWLIKDALRKDV